MKSKSPGLAVVLNMIPFILGLGYIYIGRWGRFAVVFGLQLFSLIGMSMLGLREYNTFLLAAVWLISLFDVYALAKARNRSIVSVDAEAADD